MKVALLNFVPEVSTKNYLGFNHGLGHLSAVAKQRGHQTKLFIVDRTSRSVFTALSEFSPNVILVYLATNHFGLFVRHLATSWRHCPIPLIVGGPHATCCPKEVLSLKGVTGVCIGEGERALWMILERLENHDSLEGIPNLWVKEDGEILESELGDHVADLNTLPFPDRTIFPYDHLLKTRNMNILGFEFLCARGCPHNCSYCLNPKLRSIGGKNIPIRRRSPGNLIDEIVSVISSYNYQGIVGFHDDIFTMQDDWLASFAAEYKRRVDMPFWCNTHFRNLNEKTVKLLRRAGCFRVQVGVECGNEQQRKGVLNKNISNVRVQEMTKLLKKHHIKIVANFMIGIPGETEEHVQESISLCRTISPDWVLLSTYHPYPGTALYEKLVQADLLEKDFYASLEGDTYYSESPPIVQTSLPPQKHRYYFENFVRLAK